ncbi:Holliday junction resolvase RecU [Gracilibacillus xinjiangensis]|uniref:Holliday junction resolvase RecU n=1 Tax=Gracilibacillus xinjiangensis TaxID=1193282 RepID=A0ABV8WTU5_9BACI
MATYTGKRGAALENLINYANEIYLQKGIAVINKRPTPVKVTKSKGTRIINGFFEEKSTVDFDGVYKGNALYFEAKSTKDPRFPLKNIHKHQIEYMYHAQKAGAICFFIIEFAGPSEQFLVPFDFIHHYVVHADRGGRKSIPYDDFLYYSVGLLKSQNGIPLDYLSAVDILINNVA